MHDLTLVEKGAPTEVASDLPDKQVGGGKLGKKGQRRFAPSTGRKRADFEAIQPAQWGAVWLKNDNRTGDPRDVRGEGLYCV